MLKIACNFIYSFIIFVEKASQLFYVYQLKTIEFTAMTYLRAQWYFIREREILSWPYIKLKFSFYCRLTIIKYEVKSESVGYLEPSENVEAKVPQTVTRFLSKTLTHSPCGPIF